MISFIIAGVGAAALANYLYRNRHIEDIELPVLPTRKGIYYGYYGCVGDQVKETKDHTNLLWESQFGDLNSVITNILEFKGDTLLDVSSQVFTRQSNKKFVYNISAETNLRNLFTRLKSIDALKYVKILYPIDEPNITVNSPEDLKNAITSVKNVAREFEDLYDVKLAVIYAAKPKSYTCSELYDYIGVDDYQFKSQIFTNGTYAAIKALGKKTFIIPGGAFDQDPQPFLNFANANQEVAGIIPFVWFGPREPNDKWVGIKDQGLRKQAYIDVGKDILENAK